MNCVDWENYLLENLSKYIGLKDYELQKKFNIENKASKNTWVELSYKMLDISSNKAVELIDNNIIVKTIRINKSDKIKENMSFPTIKFCELVNETWEESFLRKYFITKCFLFIVFKESDKGYTFTGGIFWRMPDSDLEYIVKSEWRMIQSVLIQGVEFSIVNGTVRNNLPKNLHHELFI